MLSEEQLMEKRRHKKVMRSSRQKGMLQHRYELAFAAARKLTAAEKAKIKAEAAYDLQVALEKRQALEKASSFMGRVKAVVRRLVQPRRTMVGA